MPTPALESAWDRPRTAAAKLVEAGDRHDNAGGLHRLAAPWSKAEKTKARAVLAEAMQALKGQLELLNSGPPASGLRSLAEPPRPASASRSPEPKNK